MSDEHPVLVTGATGYLATHIIQQLLQIGYRVRGTVRDLQNTERVGPLKELCPDATHPLELVEADLTKEAGWKEAVSGCQYVIHTASPVPAGNPPDPEVVIRPAVEGTLAVLRACREAGGVRRVVLTSSLLALTPGTVTGAFTESDWTDVAQSDMAFCRSKTLAERAAWDFVAGLPEEERFELAVLNPGTVAGPVLCGGTATCMELPRRLLLREIPGLPLINFNVVDVRDVAAAHVSAMTTPEAAGQRHVLVAENLWIKDVADSLAGEFSALGYDVPTRQAPYYAVKAASFLDKAAQVILPFWGKEKTFDNSRMKFVLNVWPRDAKQTYIDMAHSMIERGIIRKTQLYSEKMKA